MHLYPKTLREVQKIDFYFVSERTGENYETYYVNITNIDDDYIEVSEIKHKL